MVRTLFAKQSSYGLRDQRLQLDIVTGSPASELYRIPEYWPLSVVGVWSPLGIWPIVLCRFEVGCESSGSSWSSSSRFRFENALTREVTLDSGDPPTPMPRALASRTFLLIVMRKALRRRDE